MARADRPLELRRNVSANASYSVVPALVAERNEVRWTGAVPASGLREVGLLATVQAGVLWER